MNRRTRIAAIGKNAAQDRAWNSTFAVRPRGLRAVSGKRAAESRRPDVTCSMCRGPRDSRSRYCAACRDVRALVLERDGYSCTCCGISVIGQRYSLGHRLRASQGGRALPSNLLVFLGLGGESHHGRIDRRDDPEDEDRGLSLRSGADPAMVPVIIRTPAGRLRKVWLDDLGNYLDEVPEGADAA